MLLRDFKPKRDLCTLLQDMMRCVPQKRQTLYEYAFNKLALINKLKLTLVSDESIRFSVETKGISNPSILAGHLKTIDGKETYIDA